MFTDTTGEITCSEKTYKTVTIGTQTWMAENLAYLPSVNAMSESSSTEIKYYVYGYDGTNVNAAKTNSDVDVVPYASYGVLYNWQAAMAGASSSDVSPSGVQGVCPTGWHLPSDGEWTTLTQYVFPYAGANGIGNALKAISGWAESAAGTNSDLFGFSALPGGVFRGIDFSFATTLGTWWSSTQYSATSAYYRDMGSSYTGVSRSSDGEKYYGFSVRCVMD